MLSILRKYLYFGSSFLIYGRWICFQANYANHLENIVFIELLRCGYLVDVGKLDSKEIDFIAHKADEILYVKMAFEIPDNTHETDNFLHIKDNYKKF